jgi:hypothetical protein
VDGIPPPDDFARCAFLPPRRLHRRSSAAVGRKSHPVKTLTNLRLNRAVYRAGSLCRLEGVVEAEEVEGAEDNKWHWHC